MDKNGGIMLEKMKNQNQKQKSNTLRLEKFKVSELNNTQGIKGGGILSGSGGCPTTSRRPV